MLPKLELVGLSEVGTKVCLWLTGLRVVSDVVLNHHHNQSGVPQLSLGQKAVLTITPDYVSVTAISTS